MEWTTPLVFFDPLPNSFELSLIIKIIFSIISIFIIILGLLVHCRILSFVKKNDDRHVDQIIAYQARVNCFLIPISLSWLMGLQWSGEMKQFVSSQGCYIGSFLGIYYSITYKLISTARGVNSYLNVDGQVVMWCIIILSKSGWAIAHSAHPPLIPLAHM